MKEWRNIIVNITQINNYYFSACQVVLSFFASIFSPFVTSVMIIILFPKVLQKKKKAKK